MVTSKIYMDDDGNYRDKTPEQIAEEVAAQEGGEPVPFDEEGKIAGEEIPAENGDSSGEAAPPVDETKPAARTRKQ